MYLVLDSTLTLLFGDAIPVSFDEGRASISRRIDSVFQAFVDHRLRFRYLDIEKQHPT